MRHEDFVAVPAEIVRVAGACLAVTHGQRRIVDGSGRMVQIGRARRGVGRASLRFSYWIASRAVKT